MAQPVTVPKLGLTMEEGAIVEWFVEDGGRVEKGHRLYAIETDKIVSEIEAEASGYLQRLAEANAVLPVGGLVAYLHPNAESASAGKAAPPPAQAAPERPLSHAAAVGAQPPERATAADRFRVSPLAKRLASERGLDLALVTSQSADGVIHKRDIDRLQGRPAPKAASHRAGALSGTRRPLSPTRRVIAQRMVRSLSTTAQMTGFGSVDMSEAVKWRSAAIKEEKRLGVRLTYTDFALKAAAAALRLHPEINACIDGDEVLAFEDVNIALAVDTGDALVTPVLRNVDRLPLADVARERKRLVERARAGALALDDVQGGSFTLSNFGSYGGDIETPILNPPQSALLGIGAIEDQAVVRDKQIVIRPMMSISLTFDHRLIDGALAGRFRTTFRTILEIPAMWLTAMV
jgi:pyruvate/2-oxoglutarate dehydrogenase complex dihydrolipoamide acyltransferase (E2) component